VLIHSEAHLRAVLAEYQVHCNMARPHQGIGQRVPGRDGEDPDVTAVDLDAERIYQRPHGIGKLVLCSRVWRRVRGCLI